MILILDYGVGNKKNLANALQNLKIPHVISSDFKHIEKSSHIILPGVGSFGAAMKIIKANKIVKALEQAVVKKKKILGICLGMQLFFEESEENKGVKGLKFFKGKIQKIKKIKILPHIGWKKILIKKGRNKIYLNSQDKFYFLHSYVVNKANKHILAYSKIKNQKIPAVIGFKNIIGVQFHPERSGKQGLEFLDRFYKGNFSNL